MVFCTVEDVENELGVAAGSITYESIPSRYAVEQFIVNESDIISTISRFPLGTETLTVIVDYEGTGKVYTGAGNIVSITSVEVNTGTLFAPVWEVVSASDYTILNARAGIIALQNNFLGGIRRVRVIGVFGKTSYTAIAKLLCAKKIALNIIKNKANEHAYSSGVGTLRLDVFSVDFNVSSIVTLVKDLSSDVARLEGLLTDDGMVARLV